MNLSNPRKFSRHLAFWSGIASAVTTFASLCFTHGNGDFFAGVSSTVEYLTIFGFGLLILAGIVAILALFGGRVIGTTITSAIGLCVLSATVIVSYFGSQPSSRLRKLVWADAPKSIVILEHELHTSFNDGTTYTFVIAIDRQAMDEMWSSAKLSVGSRDPLLPSYFPDLEFPKGTQFYRGPNIVAAYTPFENAAYLVRVPARRGLL